MLRLGDSRSLGFEERWRGQVRGIDRGTQLADSSSGTNSASKNNGTAATVNSTTNTVACTPETTAFLNRSAVRADCFATSREGTGTGSQL
ncbi:MAG: hypothetical protein D6680_07730 [Cyanobacteria bacterium J007]|nr:MAG: hypothetical protein D6680_07730 [Cyanobacteria bacterium J007]